MLKGPTIFNRPKVYRQILGLQRAGKTELEIAEILRITPATVQYVVSINLPVNPAAYKDQVTQVDHRMKLAHEMRQAGKSFAEISQRLQVNVSRARQMVHRYDWILRHPK